MKDLDSIQYLIDSSIYATLNDNSEAYDVISLETEKFISEKTTIDKTLPYPSWYNRVFASIIEYKALKLQSCSDELTSRINKDYEGCLIELENIPFKSVNISNCYINGVAI